MFSLRSPSDFLRSFGTALAVLSALAGTLSAQKLLFADGSNDRVQQVSWPGGGAPTTLIPTAPSGLDLPVHIKVGPDGMIYLTAQGTVKSVRRYFPNGDHDTSFVLPTGGGLVTPVGLAFHPKSGLLYVSDITLGKVVIYNIDAGIVVSQITAGLTSPTGLAFDLAGNLYAGDWSTNSVCKLAVNGTAFTTFIGSGAATLNGPEDLLVQGSQIYVTSFTNGKVLRFALPFPTYLGLEAPLGTGVLSNVLGIAADSNGDIFISCNNTGKIEKYKPNGGGYIGNFSTGTAPIGLCFYKEKPAPFPARAREVVATFLPDLVAGVPNPTGACVKVVDARTGGPTGHNWLAPMFSNDVPNPLAPDAWTYANLGPVFATAIDDALAPNIYVAATSAYGSFPYTSSGGGAVFKLEGCAGDIDPWIVTGAPIVNSNKLPNASGVGLGDICYDRHHKQFFVSNMEDGKIYRFTDGGLTAKLVDSFDPFGANLDGSGLPALGDRIWGLHVYDDPYSTSGLFGKYLVFSVWLRDSAHQGTPWPLWLLSFVGASPANNALFYVQLDATGKIMPATLALLKVMPYLSATQQFSNPVSDITSSTRFLLTAEKSMNGLGIPGVLNFSHRARTLRFQLSTGIPTIDVYRVSDIGGGIYVNGASSAGGVALNGSREVWSTGDALQFPGYTVPATSDRVYGLQRFPWKGNSALTAFTWSSITKLIDLDKNVGANDKSQPGDVEVFPFTANTLHCPSQADGDGGTPPH